MRKLPFDESLKAGQTLAWQLPSCHTMSYDKKGYYFNYYIKGTDAVVVPMMVCGIEKYDFDKVRRFEVEVVTRLGVETLKLTPLRKRQHITMDGFALSKEGEPRILPMMSTLNQGFGQSTISQPAIRATAELRFA